MKTDGLTHEGPHDHMVGQKYDSGEVLLKIDRTHEPEHLWTIGPRPKLWSQVTFGEGKRFKVISHNEDGSFCLEEGTPISGPRSR